MHAPRLAGVNGTEWAWRLLPLLMLTVQHWHLRTTIHNLQVTVLDGEQLRKEIVDLRNDLTRAAATRRSSAQIGRARHLQEHSVCDSHYFLDATASVMEMCCPGRQGQVDTAAHGRRLGTTSTTLNSTFRALQADCDLPSRCRSIP